MDPSRKPHPALCSCRTRIVTRRKSDTGATRLRQPDGDGLLRRPSRLYLRAFSTVSLSGILSCGPSSADARRSTFLVAARTRRN